jgi:transporter family protein
MELMGLALGGSIALLWGIADAIATLSTRRLTTFTTTFIAQFSGLLMLSLTLLLTSWLYPSNTFTLPAGSIFTGICTGILTAIGYLCFYRSLELGPVAITCPLSSTSALVTLLLSVSFLQEQIAFLDVIAIVIVIGGVLLATIDVRSLHYLFKKGPGSFFLGKGLPWACVTPIAFGLVDVGIGGASPLHGWFAPVFFTFAFSTCLLALLFLWQHFLGRSDYSLLPSPRFYWRNRISIVFAIGAGILECGAILTFGIATQIDKPGLIAAIASNYSLIAILFGVLVLREQLVANQKLGIGMVLCGLTFLTILRIEAP